MKVCEFRSAEDLIVEQHYYYFFQTASPNPDPDVIKAALEEFLKFMNPQGGANPSAVEAFLDKKAKQNQ